MIKKIACIIVTFNRKELLLNCLNAITRQTYKPHTVYIIDNASTDGTRDFIRQNGFENMDIDGIKFVYSFLPTNIGGAGGFYTGMKLAYDCEELFDFIWVMDDDGFPEVNCLNKLMQYTDQFDYLAPLVKSLENPEKLSFPFNTAKTIEELYDVCSNYRGCVEGYACPFNGTLYSRRLITKIGYPIPELFIWGDEENYHMRAIEAGFQPVTILAAVHNHPEYKDVMFDSYFNSKVVFVPQMWKGYCHYRNKVYNNKKKWSFYSLLTYYARHSYFFLFKIHSLSWFECFNDAFLSGLLNRLNGHKKYVNRK